MATLLLLLLTSALTSATTPDSHSCFHTFHDFSDLFGRDFLSRIRCSSIAPHREPPRRSTLYQRAPGG
uniref:Putative secreted protein n=1 Tax=Anopheles triannulatus TaxID=58253 RepID=A0A2M4B1U0_9DIPT